MSNEFNLKYLNDPMSYDVALKDINEMNEIPRAFLNKQRVVKEQESVGGFRIPAENLKKRINPSEYMPLKGQNLYGGNSYQEEVPLYQESNNLIIDENAPLSENLIKTFEQEVLKLKREAEEKYGNYSTGLTQQIKYFSNVNNYEDDLQEEKVSNDYLALNPSRVQQIKHVQTNFKPEYLSLEDIQKQREEHMKVLLKTENEFYEKKKKGEQLMNLYGSHVLSKNKSFQQEIEEPFNIKEIEDLLKNEEKVHKKSLYKGKKKARSINKLVKYNDKVDKPLSKYESKYVKNFMNFLLKKKYNEANENDFNDQEDWNKTRVRSINVKAINTSKDGLPGRLDVGHVDKKDYSMYYLSIDSDSPRSLSLKSGSSRAYSGQKLNRRKIKAEQNAITHPVQFGSAYNSQSKLKTAVASKENLSTEVNIDYNSHLAFIRMIFHLIDYEKSGFLLKEKLKDTLNLDAKILSDLGFESDQDFINGLLSFQTAEDKIISEEEFVGYLLSRSQFGEEFLQNYVNKNNNWDNFSEGKFRSTNKITEDEVNYNLTKKNFNSNSLGLNNSLNKLISYNNTQSENFRTPKDKKTQWNKSMAKYNISKSAQYMMNLKRTIVNEKLTLSYNDYKEFIVGYKPRKELNVTIPIPPSFYDKPGKKEKKIKEIIEERKREEDEILGHRFKANELKREIFISQFENIIVAEKAKRQQRCEKLKQKIVQDMKPFSFYEVDEKKYKERLVKECCPPEFLPFKANPIPWTSQVNLYEDMLTKKAVERNQRVEERARQNLLSAKLPPRMEMHEKKKKLQEEELKSMTQLTKTNISKQ